MIWWTLIAGAYLLGSISFSVLVVQALQNFDVRERGSGHAGASNVLRLAGRGPAIAVLVGDIAKGVVPVQVAQALGAPGPIVGAGAMAAVVGHVFPVFHGFRGGKGVATAAGALSSLAWLPAGVSALVFLAVAAATRYVALASMTAVTAFPLLIYLGGRFGWIPSAPGWLLVTAIAIALLIVVKHRENLERLRAGTEHRLGDPPKEVV